MTRGRIGFETRLTYGALLVTGLATLLYLANALPAMAADLRHGAVLELARLALFLGVVLFLIYGNALYQLTRLGYLGRLLRHAPAEMHDVMASLADDAPPLAILIPSYKEDTSVVRKTLLSAALQQYPNRRVVLLIDDPPSPSSPEDLQNLEAARALPGEVRKWLRHPACRTEAALQAFEARRQLGHIDLHDELERLRALRQELASWFEFQAATYSVDDHADAFFVEQVLRGSERAYRAEPVMPRTDEQAQAAYRHLAAMFRVEVTSFERKRYANLSHDPSKAANLNSYLSVIGRRFREVQADGALLLEATDDAQSRREVADASYIVTLDADSLIAPEYAARLIHFMERPENERVGVVQTPYSAYPGAPGMLERIAGATTDIQYLIHQGFTRYRATFWVGANAVLRKRALDDICEVDEERGFSIIKYIKDRTVIEDTESTIDLVARGWSLLNYPERLAHSATPPDFGSLLIQRGRWANGGLIILPKLLRYLWRGPRKRERMVEGLVRFHYLSSISGVSAGLVLLLFFPFGKQALNWWLPFTALPYFMLYGRDLVQAGYRLTDLPRVYAFNLLLVPIQLAGVAKSIHQSVTGQKTAFKRTPKVTGRTAAPAWSVLAEYGAAAYGIGAGAWSLLHGNLSQAVFSCLNAVVLLYAALRFIGWQAGWEDVALGWTTRVVPALRRQRRRIAITSRYQWQRARRGGHRWIDLAACLLAFAGLGASALHAGLAAAMMFCAAALLVLQVQRLAR